jgi:hypothetical protein
VPIGDEAQPFLDPVPNGRRLKVGRHDEKVLESLVETPDGFAPAQEPSVPGSGVEEPITGRYQAGLKAQASHGVCLALDGLDVGLAVAQVLLSELNDLP